MIRPLLVILALVPMSALAEIDEFNGKMFTARGYLDVPSYELQIESKDTHQKVFWKPNIHSQTGADISINKFIGAGFSWANSDGQNSAVVYGKTTYQDYRLGFNFGRYHVETNYQVYRGFYVDNTAEVDPATNAQNIKLQDPTLQVSNTSLNFSWILDPENFSYSSALGQDKRQESSGGSWIMGISGAKLTAKSNSQLIPTTVSTGFGADQNIQNATFYTGVVRGGYGYTVAWTKKFFTSTVADAGLGVAYRTFGDSQKDSSSGGVAAKLDIAVSLGYNGDDFLTALILTADDTSYTTNSLTIPALLGDAKLAIGGHF